MKTYYKNKNIQIRSMIESDINVFYNTYLSYEWHPNKDTFNSYFLEQLSSKRQIFIAETDNKVVGICTLTYQSNNGPFKNTKYPQIEDLSVFIDYRNKGIGNLLLDIAEEEAFKISNIVTLAVGLHNGYGQAQRLYIKRGYIFDGSGVWYQGKQLDQYAPCNNDDSLLLYMYKENK